MKNSMREISEHEVMQVSGGSLTGVIGSVVYTPLQLATAAAALVYNVADTVNTAIFISAYLAQNALVGATNP